MIYHTYHTHHTHTAGVDKLAHPNLEDFQGSALLVYNDAVFTETDFQSIQRIGDSLKRAEESSKAKIGRFGIGMYVFDIILCVFDIILYVFDI